MPVTVEEGALPAAVPVDAVAFRYGLDHPQLPPASSLGAATARLGRRSDGAWTAGDQEVRLDGLGAGSSLDATALVAVTRGVVAHLNAAGIYGVWAAPEGLEERGGAVVDLRPSTERTLTVVVWASQVAEVRTLARGDRFPVSASINNRRHAWIADGSPLAPPPAAGAPGSLFLREPLEDYLSGLGVHPGRRVEASIASAGEPGRVVLDYLVTEARPWQVYAQISNTGTETTGEWRARVGAQHVQLTNRDDILSLDFVTALDLDTKGLFASYQIPLWRPDLVRLRVYGSFGDFVSTGQGLDDLRFAGDNWLGGAELLHRRALGAGWFLGAGAGFRYVHYEVGSEINSVDLSAGDSDFFLPYAMVEVSRDSGWWSTRGQLQLEHSVDGVANDDPVSGIDALGRIGVDATWTSLRWLLEGGVFVDRLFASEAGRPLAHEVSGRLRGRFLVDGDRLPAQEQDLLGGFFTVRGYPESVVAADQSFLASAEYAFHLPRSLAPADPGEVFGTPFRWRPPGPGRDPDWDLILRGFIDYGYRDVEPASGSASGESLSSSDVSLLGVGGGAEVVVKRHFSLRCDVGVALEDVADDATTLAQSGDVRVHFIASFSW